MNKILSISILALLSIFFSFCEKNNCVSVPFSQFGECVNLALVNDSVYCVEIYAPVCGCNGVTYGNSCYADKAGVLSYISGECCH